MTQHDLIIVGAGTSGMAAAIAAGEAGARVALLDAAPEWGGTLHVASGWLSGAGTAIQRAHGIDDTPAAHLDDLMRISKGTIDPVLAGKAVQLMPGAVDWLMERGFALAPECPLYGFNHEPYTERRYYVGTDWARSILAVLDAQLRPLVDAGRVDFRPGHRVTALLREGSRVVGVRVSHADGESELTAAHTIIASGGYNANPELFERISGRTLYADDAYRRSQGDGHLMVQAVGGRLRGAENFWSSFGAVLDGYDYPSATLCRPEHRPEVRDPWEITVNRRGERFVAEDEPSVDARESALLAQPEQIRHIVFDEAILRDAPPLIPGWTADDIRARCGQHPMFHSAATIDELAAKIDVPADSLRDTIAAYNENLDGEDPLGRIVRPRPIAQAAYHAITVHATSVTSAAGIAVDEQLRVLDGDGEPIEGLYAMGESLGSGMLQGQAFCGGMLATPALAFGMALGRELAPAS
ncbi:FAD-dependent oxidoreductase [Microbacterium sp. 179-I 3D3 NHS]|uniref:FAD-dependent oxidoreductase n=1 Tax=Microbacterium sp. 179-I 3D3 NHS TaxID=3142382 RepID=UPI0039A13D4D